MKDGTIGNQQATDVEIGWLAGIYDGEGYIAFTRQNAKKVRSIRPEVQMVNCDPELIVKTVGVLNKIGINPYIRERKYNGTRWQSCFHVSLSKFSDIKRFLDIVGPYLTGEKRVKADLMAQLINSRITKTKRDWYTQEELDMVDRYFNELKGFHAKDGERVRSLNDYTHSIRKQKIFARIPANEDIVLAS